MTQQVGGAVIDASLTLRLCVGCWLRTLVTDDDDDNDDDDITLRRGVACNILQLMHYIS